MFEYGNTTGNLANSGLAAIQGEWIYSRSNNGGHLYKIHTDGTGSEKLNEDDTENINVVGDWVYYHNKSDDEKLYRIRTDGTGREKLNDDASRFISVVDGSVFYMNYSDDMKLYRIGTDGANRQKLNDDQSGFINVVGDWVYYLNYNDFQIYRVRTWGIVTLTKEGSAEKLSDDRRQYASIQVAGDWVYYSNRNEGRYLYRIRTDGTDKQKMKGHHTQYINVVGDWMYYYREVDQKIYRVPTDFTS